MSLRQVDVGDSGHGHASQPPAPEGLVHGHPHRDQPLERHLCPATTGPARAWQLHRVRGCCTTCGAPWSIPTAACLKIRSRSMKPRCRSAQGKMLIAGAVEMSSEREPRRIRLAPIMDYSALSLHPFVAATSAPGALMTTDGWSGYPGLSEHESRIVGETPAHLVLKWTHRVFSNLKRWAPGTFQGLRRAHLRRCLDEFVFRWNRRRLRHPARHRRQLPRHRRTTHLIPSPGRHHDDAAGHSSCLGDMMPASCLAWQSRTALSQLQKLLRPTRTHPGAVQHVASPESREEALRLFS